MLELAVVEGFDNFTQPPRTEAFNAFFRDTSLLDAFNMTASFDFTKEFEFPNATSYDELFTIDAFETMKETVYFF